MGLKQVVLQLVTTPCTLGLEMGWSNLVHRMFAGPLALAMFSFHGGGSRNFVIWLRMGIIVLKRVYVVYVFI